MCSASDDEFVEFLIRKVDNGVVSPCLAALKKGQPVELFGPYGEFCVENCDLTIKNRFVFVATGTGIAPFRSFVKSYPALDYQIIHGVRSDSEQYFASEFKLGRYKSCISKPTAARSGIRVTDFLKQNPIDGDNQVFICGNRLMIADVFDLCREMGVPGNNIHTEVFF